MRNTKTYGSYKSMKERCLNKNHKNYNYYSNIGICEDWLESFEAFHRDMGDRPSDTTLDRIDNSKGYSKENCRWATASQQNINKRVTSNTGCKNISKSFTVAKGRRYERYFIQIKRGGRVVYSGTSKTLQGAVKKRDQAQQQIKQTMERGE